MAELARMSVGRDYKAHPTKDTDNIIEIMRGNLCMGRVHCGLGPAAYETAQRIANAWAAAPELLEACETLTRAFSSFAKAVNLDETIATGRPGEQRAAQGIHDAIAKGQAAIAKATGGAS